MFLPLQSAFSMGGGGGMVGVTVATLPRRCHQQSMSDTQVTMVMVIAVIVIVVMVKIMLVMVAQDNQPMNANVISNQVSRMFFFYKS